MFWCPEWDSNPQISLGVCFGALGDGALSGIRTHTERCLRPRSLPVGVPGLIFLTRERLPHGIVRLNRRLGL